MKGCMKGKRKEEWRKGRIEGESKGGKEEGRRG
jgi:hypothetical protein